MSAPDTGELLSDSVSIPRRPTRESSPPPVLSRGTDGTNLSEAILDVALSGTNRTRKIVVLVIATFIVISMWLIPLLTATLSRNSMEVKVSNGWNLPNDTKTFKVGREVLPNFSFSVPCSAHHA